MELKKTGNKLLKDTEKYTNQKINSYGKDIERFGDEQLTQAKKFVNNKANNYLNETEKYANIYANKGANLIAKKANEYTDKGLQEYQKLLRKGENAIDNMDGGKIKRFKKGSIEAKEYMANIRSMKGGKINFGRLIKRGVNKGLKTVGRTIKRKLVNKAGDFFEDQGRDLLRQGTRQLVNGGIGGLKAVGNYFVPASGDILDSQFDKLERIANRKVDRALDKAIDKRIRGGSVKNKITGTVINPYSNEGLHYPIVKNKKKITGGSFLQGLGLRNEVLIG